MVRLEQQKQRRHLHLARSLRSANVRPDQHLHRHHDKASAYIARVPFDRTGPARRRGRKRPDVGDDLGRAANRRHVGASAEPVNEVGPLLHHRAPLLQVLGVVVGSADAIALRVCELPLDHIRPETLLV